MPIAGGKFYAIRKVCKLKRCKRPYQIYGENFRIVHWGIPLITFWNRVPIYLRHAWHNNTVKRKKRIK